MAPVNQFLRPDQAASTTALPNTPEHYPAEGGDNDSAGGSAGACKMEPERTPSTHPGADSDSNCSFDDSNGTSEVDAEDLSRSAAAVGAQEVEHHDCEIKDESQQIENITNSTDRSVEMKAESLAEYIILSLLDKSKNKKTNDKVERTLLRCVKTMMSKHELLFKGMMKRLNITQESGYTTFVSVANELFEGDKIAVNWGRIVALYSFGGQLALHCAESKMDDFALNIATFMGRYSSEVVAPFVRQSGGWNKLCEEYPEEEDLESKAWNFLTWTAVGLGVVSAITFFTSH